MKRSCTFLLAKIGVFDIVRKTTKGTGKMSFIEALKDNTLLVNW